MYHKVMTTTLLRISLLVSVLFYSINALAQAPIHGLPMYYDDTPESYLQQASTSNGGEQRELFLLEAAGSSLQRGNISQARSILDSVDISDLTPTAQAEKTLLDANTTLQEGDSVEANRLLDTIQPTTIPQPMAIAYYQLASNAAFATGQVLHSAEYLITLDPLLEDPNAQKQNREDILTKLESLPINILNQQRQEISYGTLGGWLDIAYLHKQYANNADGFQQQLTLWQQQYPNHPAAVLFTGHKSKWWFIPHITAASAPEEENTSFDTSHIALLLPTTGKLSGASNAIQAGFMANYYLAGGNHNVTVYDTNGKDIPSLYKQAVSAGATLVVGPLSKEEVASLQQLKRLPVPTIALNTVTPLNPIKNLYQFSLSPEDESSQAALKALQDKHYRALIIGPNNAWGLQVIQAFNRVFDNQGGQIVSQINYNKNSDLNNQMKNALEITSSMNRIKAIENILGTDVETLPRRRQDLDMVFIVANPETAREIKPLLSFYFARNLPVYGTSLVYTGTPDPLKDRDLNGIEFCTLPWLIDNNGKIASLRSSLKNSGEDNLSGPAQSLYAFGFDAYSIALNLDNLQNNMNGLTGALYVDNNRQIHRQLPWATFKNGVPEKITSKS